MEVTCKCGQRFAAAAHIFGKTVDCPFCGAPISIPSPDAPSGNTVRCEFCHEYIPRSSYNRHVQDHLKLQDDGQHTDYATLPPEYRDTSDTFANAPRWYRHSKCGAVTGMPEEIIQTYLANPWFYLSDRTFCTGCGKHVPQRQCEWEETGEDLQAYTDRLRAAKPELRPNLPYRLFIKCLAAVLG